MKRLLCVLLATTAWTGAIAAPCVPTDLGPFQICVPADWTLTRRGIDSIAGKFAGDGLVVFFDFGADSDPLPFPQGSTATRESAVTVDGRRGRHAAYDLQQLHFSGVHIATAPGSALKLTLLAQAEDASRLRSADTAFSTVRFRPLAAGRDAPTIRR